MNTKSDESIIFISKHVRGKSFPFYITCKWGDLNLTIFLVDVYALVSKKHLED